MIALVPVRGGVLPGGAREATEECAGRVVLAGERTDEAVASLAAEVDGGLEQAERVEIGPFAPGRWAGQLAPMLEGHRVVVLPATPDGRDLAPRLARRLGRPLLAGASAVCVSGATTIRYGGTQNVTLTVDGPFVATLLPSPRAAGGARRAEGHSGERLVDLSGTAIPCVDLTDQLAVDDGAGSAPDATVVALVEPDPAVADLTEAERIVAGGAGLGGPATFATLFALGERLGASIGATRVVTDAGLVPHDRQIGTTGVSVWPRLYMAFGISGAAQHVGGLGEPEHIVSVNVDPSCPMMAMADLAVVADAAATLDALTARLGERAASSAKVTEEGARG